MSRAHRVHRLLAAATGLALVLGGGAAPALPPPPHRTPHPPGQDPC